MVHRLYVMGLDHVLAMTVNGLGLGRESMTGFVTSPSDDGYEHLRRKT